MANTHTHTHTHMTLSGTFWGQKNMLAKVNHPQWLAYGAHSHHCLRCPLLPQMQLWEPLVVTLQAQAGWMMWGFSLSPALPRPPWAPHRWPLVAPSLSRDPASPSPSGKREPRACASDRRGHRQCLIHQHAAPGSCIITDERWWSCQTLETEPQAHPVILAPPPSKWPYYLLMRECGKGGFNLNEPAPDFENCPECN